MATEQEIVDLLAVLSDAYPSSTIRPGTIAVYATMLTDLSAEQLKVAVKLCIARCTFFPTVAELLDEIKHLDDYAQSAPTAMEAWGAVCREVCRCGQYWRYDIGGQKPNFGDPVIERVVQGMGYRALCESDNPEADRAHFLRAYEIELKRAEEHWYLERVPEAHQIAEGLRQLSARLSAPARNKRL